MPGPNQIEDELARRLQAQEERLKRRAEEKEKTPPPSLPAEPPPPSPVALQFRIRPEGGKVAIGFNRPVDLVHLDPDNAVQMATGLLLAVQQLRMQNTPSRSARRAAERNLQRRT